MKLNLSSRVAAAFGALVLASVAGTAQARDHVHWSIGIEAAPGVSLGVANHRPVYVAPAPIYVAPAPIYVAPRPVVVAPPVYYVQPAPVYYGNGYGHHRHKHHRHHRHHRHHH